MKKYWFKPKCYGYGFCPSSWEGWIATIVFIGLVFASAYVNGFFSSEIDNKDGVRYLLDLFILSGVFTALFKDSVDGGLQWRWGDKHDNI